MPRIRSLDPVVETKKGIVSYLRQEMKDQNITQTEMADKLGTYQVTISNWFSKKNIPLDVLIRMFRILKTPPEKIGRLMT
jgi:transcriptional regulator with XRE-family HTH domain